MRLSSIPVFQVISGDEGTADVRWTIEKPNKRCGEREVQNLPLNVWLADVLSENGGRLGCTEHDAAYILDELVSHGRQIAVRVPLKGN